MEKLQFGSSGKYVDEEIARELLERVRWPDGPIALIAWSSEDLTG